MKNAEIHFDRLLLQRFVFCTFEFDNLMNFYLLLFACSCVILIETCFYIFRQTFFSMEELKREQEKFVRKFQQLVLAGECIWNLLPLFLYLNLHRPFPHSCKQRHQVEARVDKIQWFVWNCPPEPRPHFVCLLTGAECGKGLFLPPLKDSFIHLLALCIPGYFYTINKLKRQNVVLFVSLFHQPMIVSFR